MNRPDKKEFNLSENGFDKAKNMDASLKFASFELYGKNRQTSSFDKNLSEKRKKKFTLVTDNRNPNLK
jgi:hypothetical protein